MTPVHELHSSVERSIDLSPSPEERFALARVDEAVRQLKRGGAVLLCDDIDLPRTGEIVFAASRSTAELMAFAIRHGSGFVQVAIPASRCDELDLRPQVGADPEGLQHCVTVDASSGTGTGISAMDRSTTALRLASVDSTPDSFSRPGHIVPLRADMNRAAREFGFAEASILLTSRAAAGAAAVLAAIVGIGDPTAMASGEELRRFGSDCCLPLVALGDLALVHDVEVRLDQTVALPAEGAGRLVSFSDDGLECLCLIVGDVLAESDIPLYQVSADQILMPPVASAPSPRIHLAIGPALTPDLITRRLERRVGDPGCAIHKVLRAAGIREVRMVSGIESLHWTHRAVGYDRAG
ncbi:3,4-dihydroxy-2-butanone-4-phosphate synthase [Nocardia africana]